MKVTLSDTFCFRSFWITLVIIGILQFFSLPEYLNYILLVIAILFGVIGYRKRFKGDSQR